MKKFKLKSMGPKQILAYIGFLIAVLLTLKFIFELTSSGVKEVSKNPLDKCMSRVVKGTYNGNEKLAAAAAKLCLGN